MEPAQAKYKIISQEKRLARDAKIPNEWKILTEKLQACGSLLDLPNLCGILDAAELKITSDYDATALVQGLKDGNWSVEQTTIAFCKRAAIAQQLVNCLTEIFFDEAIKRARQLDKQRRELPEGKSLPPLFGLPISLKDSFKVKGVDTSTGLACFVNEPADEDSSLAALLLDLGAVLYCKTNLPQSIMTGDSDNNVFGRTLNPRNVAMTAGGSTGGEGALIALRGSLLGVGTDIAGSVRVPSVCNGIYGMRPSVGLVPHDGVRDLNVPGTDGVRSTAGPMATTLRDCAFFLKSIMQADTWKYDGAALSLSWNHTIVDKKLRIGVVEDNGLLTPTPPVRRGLAETVDRIGKSDMFDVVPLELHNTGGIYMDMFSYFTLLGGQHYQELFDRTGEPTIPSLSKIGLLSHPGTDLRGFFELNVRREETARSYMRLLRDNDLDAILMPAAPHTAVPLDEWNDASYTGIWNYLDYPAIVIPVDEVSDADQADDSSNAKYGPADRKLYNLYTGPKEYKGLPVVVQLIGHRHGDEALLSTAAVLESVLNAQ